MKQDSQTGYSDFSEKFDKNSYQENCVFLQLKNPQATSPIQFRAFSEASFPPEQIDQYAFEIKEALAQHPYACGVIKKALEIRNLDQVVVFIKNEPSFYASLMSGNDHASVKFKNNEAHIYTIPSNIPDFIDRVMFELCNAANEKLHKAYTINLYNLIKNGPNGFAYRIEKAEFESSRMMVWLMETKPHSDYWQISYKFAGLLPITRYPKYTLEEYWQKVNTKRWYFFGSMHSDSYRNQWKNLVNSIDYNLINQVLIEILKTDDIETLKLLCLAYDKNQVKQMITKFDENFINEGRDNACFNFLLEQKYIDSKLLFEEITHEQSRSSYL